MGLENMNVRDFATYVLNNLGRATLANALNIADKIDNPQFYTFADFADCIQRCAGDEKIIRMLGSVKIAKIVSASYDCVKAYNSDFKYNKRMIVDNYIISLWRAVNDK